MNAPKKIWIDELFEAHEEEILANDISYIRADLVDKLVEALEDMVDMTECSGNLARDARTALKALEEE